MQTDSDSEGQHVHCNTIFICQQGPHTVITKSTMLWQTPRGAPLQKRQWNFYKTLPLHAPVACATEKSGVQAAYVQTRQYDQARIFREQHAPTAQWRAYLAPKCSSLSAAPEP